MPELPKSSHIQTRVLRTRQLDAGLLDHELVRFLQDPLTGALGSFNSSLRTRFDPELTLAIQLILYYLSVYTAGASYGAKLQDIRYRTHTTTHPSKRTLAIHSSLTILIPYIHVRIRRHALSNAWPEAPTSSMRRKTWELISKIEVTHTTLVLACFIAFLYDGRYATLTERILRLRLTSVTRLARREVNYEFMNRQMVWYSFTEFLLFVLPLLPRRTIRRATSTALTAATFPMTALFMLLPSQARNSHLLQSRFGDGNSKSKSRHRGPYQHLPDAECAICRENTDFRFDVNVQLSTTILAQNAPIDTNAEAPTHPILTPYRTSCGHVYCYVCVADKLLRAADEGTDSWTCLRCAEPVRRIERVFEPAYWAGDGDGDEGSVFEYGSDYFDELGSSMSAASRMSMGSRSWSEGDQSE